MSAINLRSDSLRTGVWQLKCLATSLIVFLYCTAALAQPAGELPTARYYAARELFRVGNVVEAAQGFNEVLALSQRSANDGWMDSVPTRVMLAECHYHQGEIAKALEFYDAALMTMLKYPDWIGQFNLGENVTPLGDAASKGINWFKLSQPSTSLSLPSSVQLAVDLTQARTDAQGNVTAPLNVTARLDSTEVLRAIAVALVRRWQLLGPLAKHSPLTNPLVQYFANNTSQNQPWAQSSWHALQGLAMLSQDTESGAPLLVSAAFINNRQYDYFLTPLLLQVQGEIAANKGQYQAAIANFQDASILAARYLQFDQLSETLLWIGDCACANERVDLLEPLLAAGNWAGKKSAFVQVATLSASTELAAYAGKSAQARKLIAQEAGLLKSSKGALPRFQARLAFNEALLAFQDNQFSSGWARINDAVSLMRGTAATGPIPSRVYQQQFSLDLLFNGHLLQIDGERVLAQLLAEPDKTSWELRPLETLASLTTAAVPAYRRWLSLADMADQATVISRVDQIQQRQVFEAMPLGGRPYSWMKAVMIPPGDLPPDVRPIVAATKQTLPQLDATSQQLTSAIEKFRNTPFQLDERQIKNDQKQTFTQMEDLAERLESQLMVQSLSRKSIRRFVPGEINVALAQQRLAPGDLLLGMVEVGEQIVCVAISQDQVESWLVPDGAGVIAKLNSLYQQIGLAKTQRTKPTTRPTDPTAEWRATSAEIYQNLFAVNPQIASLVQSSRRIIVAPHGRLWYLPMELLIGPNRMPVVSTTAVTYVPTLGSYEFAFASTPPSEHSLLLLGSFFTNDKSINAKEASKVADVADGSTVAAMEQRQNLPSSQWLRSRADELVLLAELVSKPDDANLRVLPIDNHTKSRLGDWIGSTLKTPSLLLLPGMDTSIRSGEIANGSEIFLPVAAMLYSGSRGVVSRWSVGGESSSRFLQRARWEMSGSKSISGALRKSSIALWVEQFATASEPILLPAGSDSPVLTSGEHPLLWSSYMAIGDRAPK